LTHPTSPYKRDNSTVHSLGFGLDYNLTQQWAVRGDYQFEHWHVAANNTFEPRVLSFGVVYTIPFRPYKPH
jgi:opacity protein-like surface antigen